MKGSFFPYGVSTDDIDTDPEGVWLNTGELVNPLNESGVLWPCTAISLKRRVISRSTVLRTISSRPKAYWGYGVAWGKNSSCLELMCEDVLDNLGAEYGLCKLGADNISSISNNYSLSLRNFSMWRDFSSNKSFLFLKRSS